MDYLGGLWSTLNIPNVQHDLAVVLSDIHLAYRGNCTYGLLCKQANLGTIGKLLMEHKLRTKHESLIKPNAVVLLRRIDKEYPSTGKFVNEELSSHEYSLLSESDDTEIYDMAKYVEADSDSTEIYEINEQIIGTITYNTTKLPFKSPLKLCNIRCDTRKKISSHYKQSHKKNQQMQILLQKLLYAT